MLTRFAPSPTGLLHLGHAAAAFHVWDAARSVGGSVRLRIEDIDRQRCRPEFEAAILEDLAWLGLDWDGPVRRQSEHFSAYRTTIEALADRGLVYRCFRTRADIAAQSDRAPHGAEPRFRGRPLPPAEEQARLTRGDAHAWRLSVEAAQAALGARASKLSYRETGHGPPRDVSLDWQALSDVVLARKDVPTSYHLACTHDDALQGVTHIVRGDDLVASTPVHVVLQALMDWPTPVYHHHALVRDEQGKRFAKRNRSMTLSALRKKGVTPDDIRRMTLGHA